MSLSLNNVAEAEIILRFPNEDTAQAVAEAVTPDNLQVPEGLNLVMDRKGEELSIKVRCSKGVGSLLSTLDDLLSCINAAEKSLNGLS
jgi:tRNA threonylcarbamoyladenosine modification (KEOPS) complex  Pcc1 subunit